MILHNKAYDIMKWVIAIVLPALGTMYFALCGIWGLPFGEEVLGTLAAVETFLGAILGISTQQYNALEYDNATAPELDENYYEGGDEDE